MSKVKRLIRAMKYFTPSRFIAAYGLLTSESRDRWLNNISPPTLEANRIREYLPWYTFGAIDYLQDFVDQSSNLKVLELGAGYSTLWWSLRASKVVSLERNRDWSRRILAVLEENGADNVDIISPREKSDWQSENEYMQTLSTICGEFDVVVIDDIHRGAVLVEVLNRLKPVDLIVLDDSERNEYKDSISRFESQNNKSGKYSYFGSSPYHFVEKETTIWRLEH